MRIIVFFVFSMLSIAAIGQVGEIKPFDQSSEDPDLKQFIERLKVAVNKRDKEYIKTIIATSTYIPFEGGETTTSEEFYDFYFNQTDHGYDLWEDLEYIFSIGGGGFGKSKNEFYMPYTSANIHDSDPFTELGTYVIALSPSTHVYERPDTNSKIVATLNYNIVEVDYEEYRTKWETIVLDTGRKGYVKSSDVIYTVSTRSGFIKEDGKWKLKFAGPYE